MRARVYLLVCTYVWILGNVTQFQPSIVECLNPRCYPRTYVLIEKYFIQINFLGR